MSYQVHNIYTYILSLSLSKLYIGIEKSTSKQCYITITKFWDGNTEKRNHNIQINGAKLQTEI